MKLRHARSRGRGKAVSDHGPEREGATGAPHPADAEPRSRAFWLINGGLMLLAKLGLVTVILTVAYTVVMRLLFDDSPSWTFDLSSLMMLPLTFLVAGPIAAAKGHVTVDVVVELTGPRVRRVLEALGQTISAVFLLYMAYHVADRFFDIYESGQVTGSARLPYWPAALAVPIGLIALAAEFTREAVVSVRHALQGSRTAS